jgi:hypothetical protein
MSASCVFSPCAATFTVPVCCADAPHCAQNGLFDAGGGGGGVIEFVDELPHDMSKIPLAAIATNPVQRINQTLPLDIEQSPLLLNELSQKIERV